MVVCPAITFILLAVVRAINISENRRRDARDAASGLVHVENSEFLDLTDGENPEFRYAMVCQSRLYLTGLSADHELVTAIVGFEGGEQKERREK